MRSDNSFSHMAHEIRKMRPGFLNMLGFKGNERAHSISKSPLNKGEMFDVNVFCVRLETLKA